MPNRISEAKANAIAAEYCTNGYDKVKAMLAMGYSKYYASHNGMGLWDNALVKQGIARIQAANIAKTAVTVQTVIAELDEIQALSKGKADYSTMARCAELKGKTIGAFIERSEQIVQQLPPLDAAEAAELKAIAHKVLEDNSKNTDRAG